MSTVKIYESAPGDTHYLTGRNLVTLSRSRATVSGCYWGESSDLYDFDNGSIHISMIMDDFGDLVPFTSVRACR